MREYSFFIPVLFVALQVSSEPLTLERALQEALSSSVQSKIFDEKLVKSREFENEKRGMLYPKVDLYGTVGRGAQPISNPAKLFQPNADVPDYVNMAANVFNYGVQASGPIYTFGKLSTAIEMAQLQDKSVKLSVKKDKQDLQMSVVEAYSASVLATAKIAVLERSRDRSFEVFTALDRDFQAGKGMKSDVLMAKASLKALEPQIIAAKRDAASVRQNLNRLLGRATDDNSPLDSAATMQVLESDPLPPRAEALKNAIENRSDLQSLETAADVYEGTSKIFQANYYPTIAYQGKFGFTGSEPEHMVEWVHREWLVGVGLTWTLFDGLGKDGANRAQVAQWKSDSRVFRFQSQELRRVVEMEVDKALADRAAMDTSLQASIEGREAANEAVSILRANYPGGMIKLSDIQSAEDGLRNAELGVLAARFNRISALAKLRIVQGIDLVPVPEVQ